ncbi:hypothetical protein [Actinotalea sp. Marseille-Q4924]|uniref:hypothetical protein n=1 Tax=Actinotalea sp. Marseille-Q4924 TaxID=2866571 RepID=UPI001CE3C9C8|nr:hypothetical protein [Actinotalea sp. Marseille-Q4924]
MSRRARVPKNDLKVEDRLAAGVALIVPLVFAAVVWRFDSLPGLTLVVGAFAVIAAAWASPTSAFVRYAVGAAAAFNGGVLTLIISVTLSAVTSAGAELSEADTEWIVVLAVAALVTVGAAAMYATRTGRRAGAEQRAAAELATERYEELLRTVTAEHGSARNRGRNASAAAVTLGLVGVGAAALRRARRNRA